MGTSRLFMPLLPELGGLGEMDFAINMSRLTALRRFSAGFQQSHFQSGRPGGSSTPLNTVTRGRMSAGRTGSMPMFRRND